MRPLTRETSNTVFQDYALFPHMTGRRNRSATACAFFFFFFVSVFPRAEESGASRKEILESGPPARARRRKAGATVGGHAASGRARAFTRLTRPRVLLLESRLGALDLKSAGDADRVEAPSSAEVSDSGITFVYVTHDQAERSR